MLFSIFQEIAGNLFFIIILLFQWIVMMLLGEIRREFGWWNIRIGCFLCLAGIFASISLPSFALSQVITDGFSAHGLSLSIANGIYYLGVILFLSGLIVHPATFSRRAKDIN